MPDFWVKMHQIQVRLGRDPAEEAYSAPKTLYLVERSLLPPPIKPTPLLAICQVSILIFFQAKLSQPSKHISTVHHAHVAILSF